MAGHRFFVPPTDISSKEAVITGDECHHLRRVLRLEAGDEIAIFDGTGREFSAVITQLSSNRAQIELLAELTDIVESPFSLTLAQALIKGDRFDLVIQKATELGVTSLQPLVSRYTDVQLSESRAEKRVERWQRIALEATKQCGRRKVMEIANPLSWSEFLSQNSCSNESPVIFFAEQGGNDLYQIVNELKALSINKPINKLVAVVGSEGGWSAEEMTAAQNTGYYFATLGPRILRAETAGITVSALLQHLFGDLG